VEQRYLLAGEGAGSGFLRPLQGIGKPVVGVSRLLQQKSLLLLYSSTTTMFINMKMQIYIIQFLNFNLRLLVIDKSLPDST
jgi:hypothetical protein